MLGETSLARNPRGDHRFVRLTEVARQAAPPTLFTFHFSPFTRFRPSSIKRQDTRAAQCNECSGDGGAGGMFPEPDDRER